MNEMFPLYKKAKQKKLIKYDLYIKRKYDQVIY